MGIIKFMIVSAVTEVNNTGLTIILGHGCAAYVKDKDQTKALVNYNELRNNGVEVNYKTSRDGGKNNIVVDGITFPLNLMDEKILYFSLRSQYQEYLAELTIHWLIPQNTPVRRVVNCLI